MAHITDYTHLIPLILLASLAYAVVMCIRDERRRKKGEFNPYQNSFTGMATRPDPRWHIKDGCKCKDKPKKHNP